MLEVGLLALVGTAVLTALFESSSNNEEPAPEILPAPPSGEDLLGTVADEFHEVDEVNYEEGNYYDIDMGGGNDTLVAGNGHTIDMGDGNDTLRLDIYNGYDYGGPTHLGAGDDTIEIRNNIGQEIPDGWHWTNIVGGEGSDSYHAELTVNAHDPFDIDPEDTSSYFTHSGIWVRDFEPDEDTFEIEIVWAEGHEERELTSVEIINGSRGSYISFQFAGTEQYRPMSTSIYLDTPRPLTADDISLVNEWPNRDSALS